MTQQHITKIDAQELVRQCGLDWHRGFIVGDESNRYGDLCNAAIQHYLDQRKAELPVLPVPYFGSGRYLGAAGSRDTYTITQIRTYGAACAAQARERALEGAKQACTRRIVGDHSREDAEAKRCAEAIEQLKARK